MSILLEFFSSLHEKRSKISKMIFLFLFIKSSQAELRDEYLSAPQEYHVSQTISVQLSISPHHDTTIFIDVPFVSFLLPHHEAGTADVYKLFNNSYQFVGSLGPQIASFGVFFPNQGKVVLHSLKNVDTSFYAIVSTRKCRRIYISTFGNETFGGSKSSSKSHENSISPKNSPSSKFLSQKLSKISNKIQACSSPKNKSHVISEKVTEYESSELQKTQIKENQILNSDILSENFPSNFTIQNNQDICFIHASNSNTITVVNYSIEETYDLIYLHDGFAEKELTGDGNYESIGLNTTNLAWHSDSTTLSNYFSLTITSNSTLPSYRVNFSNTLSTPLFLTDHNNFYNNNNGHNKYDKADASIITTNRDYEVVNLITICITIFVIILVLLLGVTILIKQKFKMIQIANDEDQMLNHENDKYSDDSDSNRQYLMADSTEIVNISLQSNDDTN
ncbi:hypothetical protein TRFO_41831 [Tritrichomonas foetus]|uniref:Uncharacterized protein n=1 Tax=Tritrichomonas foetus TaxID=1144522 RepID=A0A1J4L300_9EUKA|nr:hypothetical protein TRFO_41831 [Tritrichomonas foetus]|eukprot:OHT16348.1 hypothetical protein TRFO_41831 [Tritrichomonas foetus]